MKENQLEHHKEKSQASTLFPFGQPTLIEIKNPLEIEKAHKKEMNRRNLPFLFSFQVSVDFLHYLLLAKTIS